MKPLSYAIIKHFTEVPEACAEDEVGNLRIYYRANEEQKATINRYIKD